MQLELERIKTFKLQKTSPQKLAKGSIKVGAKSSWWGYGSVFIFTMFYQPMTSIYLKGLMSKSQSSIHNHNVPMNKGACCGGIQYWAVIGHWEKQVTQNMRQND
jgi:hypothetical protein